MNQKIKNYKSTARESLARLLRDSLELNDRQNVDLKQKQEVEDEILDDFLAVLDYIKYIELKTNYDEYTDTIDTQKQEEKIN